MKEDLNGGGYAVEWIFAIDVLIAVCLLHVTIVSLKQTLWIVTWWAIEGDSSIYKISYV